MDKLSFFGGYIAVELIQKILETEFEGMSEVLYNLYSVTGNGKYRILVENSIIMMYLILWLKERTIWPGFMLIPRFRRLLGKRIDMKLPEMKKKERFRNFSGKRLSKAIHILSEGIVTVNILALWANCRID